MQRALSRVAIAASLIGVLQIGGAAWAQTADPGTIAELRRLLAAQQAQMEAQARAIADLKAQIDALAAASLTADAAATAKAERALAAADRAGVQAAAAAKTADAPRRMAQSGNDEVSLTISGQVNRGVLFTDDGENQDFFHVDNDNSSTRVRFVGTAKASDSLTVGSKIEVQFESNSTASVNQTSDRAVGPNNFTERFLELWLQSDDIGKLYVGQGDTASNGTSEVDLSGTAVVGYSGVTDMAGGILFVDSTTKALTATNIGSVMSNMDGLSRDDRLRYDTPSFAGFVASGSLVAGGAADVALRYSRKFDGVKLAGAIAYANQSGISATVEDQVNGSVSALTDSGFNLTLAAGTRGMKAVGRDDPVFYYGKVGYIAKALPVGPTAVSLDYGRFEDVAQDDDEADTVGLMLVQNLSDWGTELYLGYRWHSLDRLATDVEDINAVLAGARVKF